MSPCFVASHSYTLHGSTFTCLGSTAAESFCDRLFGCDDIDRGTRLAALGTQLPLKRDCMTSIFASQVAAHMFRLKDAQNTTT